MFFSTRILAAVACLLIGSSASRPVHAESRTCEKLAAPVPSASWISSCKHPLCGFAFDMRASTSLERSACPAQSWAPLLEAIRQTLSNGGIVALGEVHDNGAHHRARADLLKGAKSVVFEQIRTDKAASLDTLYAANAKLTADQVIKAVEWDKSGWPIEDYKVVLESAVASNARIYPGDATKDMMRAISMGEDAKLSGEDRVRLALDQPLGKEQDDASLEEIEISHCRMMPKEALGGMAAAQRYRDAALADATLKAALAQGSSVIIAGNGHVRNDRGVPWYLAKRAPKTPVLSVVFVEVEDGQTDLKDYGPRDPGGRFAADFVVFTPRPEKPRGDPCDRFKSKKKAG